MRWKQVYNPETKKYEMIPMDSSAARRDQSMGVMVKGNFEPFKSHIDGSVINTQKKFEEHCRRYNVVPSQEFSQDYYERKAKERSRLYTGEHTKQEKLARKQQINEIINHFERR